MQLTPQTQENDMSAIRPTAITEKQVSSYLKPRPKDSHKGMFGTVAVIGGTNGMVGAALLAGRAALKLGAGCVHVGLLAENPPAVDGQMPELMLNSANETLKLTTPDVIVIGCGLGRSLFAQKLLYDALLLDKPSVIDADALHIIAIRPDLRAILHTRKAATVFTPHPGEAAHLLACGVSEIQEDRIAAVTKIAKKFGGNVVLKGSGSLCATSDGKLYLNKTGNAGMSSAGMGDVLSGMIAAFLAQGLSADNALLLAVYLHGAAGDALAQQQAQLGMSATEVTEWARWLLNRMVGQ